MGYEQGPHLACHYYTQAVQYRCFKNSIRIHQGHIWGRVWVYCCGTEGFQCPSKTNLWGTLDVKSLQDFQKLALWSNSVTRQQGPWAGRWPRPKSFTVPLQRWENFPQRQASLQQSINLPFIVLWLNWNHSFKKKRKRIWQSVWSLPNVKKILRSEEKGIELCGLNTSTMSDKSSQ